ncbi:MAG: response regulator [Hyphomicrobium sp.]
MARILLADDDSAVRDLVRRALTSDGHAVDVTQDGSEALERLSVDGAAFDVLVSDVDMPGLDGIALAEKALVLSPAMAIVLMSGLSDQLERAGKIGAVRFAALSKPFTLEQIKQTVRGVLA